MFGPLCARMYFCLRSPDRHLSLRLGKIIGAKRLFLGMVDLQSKIVRWDPLILVIPLLKGLLDSSVLDNSAIVLDLIVVLSLELYFH